MAGGDGSLAVVAAVAAGHGIPFVCVPAGTRNHFALDVGVDRHDVIGALDAFTDGVERTIDMAEVNGRAFLNNGSLRIYGDAVRGPAYHDAKAHTLLETAAKVMGQPRRRPPCTWSTTWGTGTVISSSFSCRTTPMLSIARWPAAPARRSAADSSGSPSSTRPATAPAPQGEPGALRAWRSEARNRSTPELTVRRWNSVRHCGSLSARRRCGPDLLAPPGRLAISAPAPPGPPARNAHSAEVRRLTVGSDKEKPVDDVEDYAADPRPPGGGTRRRRRVILPLRLRST
jgi:Diacylglycerol kinase catalytic domain